MRNKAISWPVFETTIAGFSIRLERQKRKHRYTVVYGKQERSGLTYANAALELGLAMMHALTCEGKFDEDRRDP